jgi:hypothetical protein
MSDYFDSTELVSELALESDKEEEAARSEHGWYRLVAISTLVMAVITAVGALLSGITAHRAILDRTEELMDVSIYENDRVSIEVLRAKVEILSELGEAPDADDLATIEAFEAEIERAREAAALEESDVQLVGVTHLTLALAVTTLSVGITLSGMAVIVDEKLLWLAGMVFALLGTIGVGYGIYTFLF